MGRIHPRPDQQCGEPTRSLARLSTAYPADPRDALDALIGTDPWPGSSVVWAMAEAGSIRLVARP